MNAQPSLQDDLTGLQQEALEAIASASDAAALEQVRIKYLARSGSVPALMERLKSVSAQERPALGQAINTVKNAVQEAFASKQQSLSGTGTQEDFDATLPGRPVPTGSLHPLTQTRARAVEIFHRLGYVIADGPDVDFEYYNFDALNAPPDHPSRDAQDTFFLASPWQAQRTSHTPTHPGKILLRAQTSTVQVRATEGRQPPIRVVAPGRCYRRDEIDATHGMSFHQMEGMCVDEGITVGHLKGTLEFFFRELMGKDLEFRWRPHFFPFTEPSFEVDCRRPGKKIRGKEWLEICGCGMTDPNVLEGVGIDSEKYTGFAFGFGLERVAMLTHSIPDLRLFLENDVRFLSQFGDGSANA